MIGGMRYFMKKSLLLFIFLTLGFSLAGETNEKIIKGDSRFEEFDSYLKEIKKAYHIPGLAFIVTDSEETLYSKNLGQCTSLDQQFFIGSMSKSFTALSVMQLVEKGLINLEDDISVYLPEYKFEKTVSIRQLLNHTSGFDTHARFADFKITESYGKYEYANINYDLLGKIIEKVSGKSYEDYVAENIFSPIGMKDSNAKAISLKTSSKLLKGNRNYFGFFKQGEADYPVENSWFHEPAGYIASTPHDYEKYLRIYLNRGLTEKGERIIKKETIDSMWYENVSLGVPEYDAYYGKGWNYMNYDGQKLVFHGGQVENGITYMFILPEKQLAVCFMINANDYFGTTSLMNNAVWNSLAILKGNSPEKVNHASYILIHLFLNLIYFAMLALSCFMLIKAIVSKHNKAEKQEIKKVRRVIGIILNILGYVVWPVFLLTFTKALINTPLWVVKSYVPDFYCIIWLSAFLAVAGGIIKLFLYFFSAAEKR